MPGEMIQLRHPDPTKKTARIANDAYAVARRTILAIVPAAEPGITLNAYLAAVAAKLPKAKGWDPSLSASWYAMAMKLDLEARGELKRINTKPPQRLVRT
jgi:plasmid maintenance system antidote protein VapI